MIRAGLKFFVFFLLCLVIVPSQSMLLLFTKGPKAYILTRAWHAGVCRIFGIKIRQSGVPYYDSQVIYMSNHMSYMDIPVLGSLIKNASFVSKNDVANWPVWGFLSTLQQTAFISRSRSDTQKEAYALDTMLENKKNLVIFPEGTTGNGLDIMPFKSSLFALTLKDGLKDLVIQPVSLQIRAEGAALQKACQSYAWPKEDARELHHHLWDLAKTSGVEIAVTFHPIIEAKSFNDRKILAKQCHEAVCNGLTIQHAA